MRSALPSAVSWVVLESATHFSCFSNPLTCREQSVMFVGGSLASVRGSHSSTDAGETAHNRFSFLGVFAPCRASESLSPLLLLLLLYKIFNVFIHIFSKRKSRTATNNATFSFVYILLFRSGFLLDFIEIRR